RFTTPIATSSPRSPSRSPIRSRGSDVRRGAYLSPRSASAARAASAWPSKRRRARDARRRSLRSHPSGGGVSAHELPNDPVELLRVLHKHEVVPALALLEDLQPGPADLVRDPGLRLPGHEAGLAAHNESRNVDPGDDAAPVARGVVVQ